MTTDQLAEIAEYCRGYQDALRGHGYNDRSTNTQGRLTVLGLCFREHAHAYARGYEDAASHEGWSLMEAMSEA